MFFYKRGKLAGFDEGADLRMAAAVVVIMVVPLVTVAMGIVRVFVLMLMRVGLALVRVLGVGMFVFVSVGLMFLVGMSVFVLTVGMSVLTVIAAFVAVVVCIFGVLVRRALVNAKLHAFHTLPLPSLKVHVKIPDRELRELPFERGRLDAKIDERADGHVAADAGRTIEKEDFHGKTGGWFLVVINAGRRVRRGAVRHRRVPCR